MERLKVVDLAEVLSRDPNDEPIEMGNWTILDDPLRLALCSRPSYEIPVGDATTSAKLLDWICQLAEKRWISDADLGSFVRIFNQLIRPQARLCGTGIEHGPIDAEAVAQRRLKYRERQP